MQTGKEQKITDTVQEILWNNIKLYDEKNNRDYFICFSLGKNHVPCYEQIAFRDENYWHLLGCKLAAGNSEEIYNKCLSGEELKNDIVFAYQHSFKDVREKDEVFRKMFDFISHAKEIDIAYASEPDSYTFQMAMGRDYIVGYGVSRQKENRILHPRTCQQKSIQNISRELNKIMFILSKDISKKKYSKVEYCVKKVDKKYDVSLIKDIIVNNYNELDLFEEILQY